MALEKIIVALQDSATREALVEALRRLDFEVFVAADAAELRALVTRQAVALICLGPDMDDLDYPAFIGEMTGPAVDYVPVLMVGQPDKLPQLARFFTMGATDFIVPPFMRMDIRINNTLGIRHTVDGSEVNLQELVELNANLKQHVLPLGHVFATEPDLNRLAGRVVQEAQRLCRADGGTLYLMTKDNRLEFVVLNTQSLNVTMGGDTGVPIPFPPLNLYDPETGEENRRNVATATAFRQETIHVPNVYDAEGLDFTATKTFDAANNYRTVSCLTIPMMDSNGKVMGVLELLNATNKRTGEITPFKPNNQLLAESLAMQAAVAIENYFLMQQRQELIKFETDVHVGRTVQASFLPRSLPEPKGWEIAAQFHPAREVAGDFYDVFEVRRNLYGLVMADVCDKGVPAAIYMALARSVIRAFSRQTYSLSWADSLFEGDQTNSDDERRRPDFQSTPLKEGLTRANNYLVANHSDLTMFVTVFFALLNTKTGHLMYVNAGHNPPLVLDASGIKTRLKPSGPVVGVIPDMPFKIETTELEPGDTLLMFTDGVPDARSPEHKMFTDARLEELVTSGPVESSDALLKSIETALWTHIGDAYQFDDITMMAVRREGA